MKFRFGRGVVVLLVIAMALVGCEGAPGGPGESPLVGADGQARASEAPPIPEEAPEAELSGAWIAGFVALLLSLAASYAPGFSAFWDGFTHKREALGLAGFILAWGLVGLHYLGAVDLGLSGGFGWPVVWQVLRAWLAFAGAGQLAYTVERIDIG